MPARRANNYALLSQSVDSVEPAERHRLNYEYAHHQRFLQQQTHVQTHYSLPDRLYSDQSAEKGPFVFEHDRSPWHPAAAAAARVSSGGGGGLQRQSSGSSYGESSLSSDYPLPTLTISPSASLHACDSAAFFNGLYENTGTAVDRDRNNSGNNKNNAPRNSTGNGIGNGNVGCGKNWAQQTEESYHLQLALALRVSADASSSEDPHFLGDYVHERRSGSGGRPSPASASHMAQDLSHRFWVTGCLSYYDRIPNGFYYICGMNPFVWTMCNDLKENRMPSLESLKSVDASDSSFEVILIDKKIDPFLKELETKALKIAFGSGNTQEVVVQELAKLVCWHLGGTASIEDEKLTRQWDSASKILRSCLESIVFPIGSLSMGLCRHRSLLFKVLADSINFRCRIARGCRYCKRDDGSSCIIQYGNDREYVVDLIGRPGVLSEPDSFLNGPSSLMVASPLRLPELKPSLFNEELGYLITKYKHDFRSLDIGIKAQATETSINSGPATVASVPQSESSITGFEQPPETLASPVQAMIHSFISGPAKMPNTATSSSLLNEKGVTNDSGHPGVQLGFPKVARALKDVRREEEVSLAKEGLEIPWSELELKERIGQGSFGTVYHADWRKSDVAVKILSELDFHDERLKEYLREVAIMKRLRHPNVVLFMGAVLSPKLAIVTEYLPRGSLYRLIHRHGVREHLNERRRLRMALDVATGMNYLHQLSPPIVHRDLKSPNLLVDKSWTVKVCDFGLSRLKANTFLSSKSAAGTPEWMAPEVLRDEPSNEKSDVYSFGVILWELITLQQPWSSLNPAQVVGAVGFQNRRLPIPNDVSPEIATIIESCWANDPRKRPSFATIMDSLKLLVKLPTLHPSQGGEH